MTAAIAMLNDKHPQLQNPVTDSNAYALGTPAGHNVVIACLPFGIYGTVCIRHGGDFAPDVDVYPDPICLDGWDWGRRAEAVVQYDYGETVRGGRFEQTGMLNHPPQLLLTHISRLEAERRATKDNNGISGVIAKVLDERPSMIDDSNDNCNDCDSAQKVQRDPLGSLEPQVCYGLIALGDKVMKDSQTRDRLAHKTGAICFEMGTAGLMNQLPCLVIRGICDYADSYKNRKWQGYAALTAAVYGKLLSSAVANMPLPGNIPPSGMKKNLTQDEKNCLRSLFLTDPVEDKNALKRRKGDQAPYTCQWFLKTRELQEWLKAHPIIGPKTAESSARLDLNILWLYGNPGTRKLTIAITIVEELPNAPFFDKNKVLAYFFCDSSSSDRSTAQAVLRGILYQLIKNRPGLIDFVLPKFKERGEKLWNALDECDAESQEILLSQIQRTFQAYGPDPPRHLHILVTSRPYPEIVAKDLQRMTKAKVKELGTRNRYSTKVATEVSSIKERPKARSCGSIPESVLETAAKNPVCGRDVVAVILHRRGYINITESALKAAAQNRGQEGEVVSLLLDHRESELEITEDVLLKATVNDPGNTKEVMMILLERHRGRLHLSDNIVEKDPITLNSSLLTETSYNALSGGEVMEVLLKRCSSPEYITANLLINFSTYGEVNNFLLEHRRGQIEMTEDIISDVVQNVLHGESVMLALLRRCRNPLEESQVIEIAEKFEAGVIKLLLEQDEHSRMAKTIIPAIADTWMDRKKVALGVLQI
ncbi:uncharacterized protein BDW43DRAFT_315536 [Aspergillus alliaceus]|uniref:uncharacterized protein n=1 Tax=Petromyces alliaceus TaxID=209559 RepID=UPI0012A692A9|nr:uncharacterized protein BDW43DRAFT_315536 [Aspergillus alliaceus]KAB8228766.1 hypothetical protein BDW43DRAFT_315536 [Aspergillus alliaceus]